MRLTIAAILAIFLTGCFGNLGGSLDGFDDRALYNDDSDRILSELLPIDEWKSIYPNSNPAPNASALIHDYGDKGKLISLQRNLDRPGLAAITVAIQDEESIRLRHQIIVGTDLASWELIRKETTWPDDMPFKRIYLFKRPEGQGRGIRGLVFFDGVKVEISYPEPFTEQTISDVEALTWKTAERLEIIYERELKAISEGPLFQDNPVLKRPDLPDPDINSEHPTTN